MTGITREELAVQSKQLGITKLLETLKKRIQDDRLTPADTLVGLLSSNGIQKPGKMPRSEQEQIATDALHLLDYTRYLPQRIPLTTPFLEKVLDPVMSVPAATGLYRITIRKLLRLSLAQLQKQAERMDIDFQGLDEKQMATQIMIGATQETELIPELAHMLLAKEMAYVFGVKFQVPVRGSGHPSSTVSFVVRPNDMVTSTLLEKEDYIAELDNQGISYNPKDSTRQLAVKLIVWLSADPKQVREPLTPAFANFLLAKSRQVRR